MWGVIPVGIKTIIPISCVQRLEVHPSDSKHSFVFSVVVKCEEDFHLKTYTFATWSVDERTKWTKWIEKAMNNVVNK
jgi:hypothetical protein